MGVDECLRDPRMICEQSAYFVDDALNRVATVQHEGTHYRIAWGGGYGCTADGCERIEVLGHLDHPAQSIAAHAKAAGLGVFRADWGDVKHAEVLLDYAWGQLYPDMPRDEAKAKYRNALNEVTRLSMECSHNVNLPFWWLECVGRAVEFGTMYAGGNVQFHVPDNDYPVKFERVHAERGE